MKGLAGKLMIVPALVGPIVFATLILSPRIGRVADLALVQTVPVAAHVTSCTPFRAGRRRETIIRCRLSYHYGNRTYAGESDVWSSQSPFLTSAGLNRELVRQSAMTRRTAGVVAESPMKAMLRDDRWLAMPPLWTMLTVLFGALAAVTLWIDPAGIPYRRAELVKDPITNDLIPIDNRRRNRIRRRLAVQAVTAMLAGGICLFGLSNQPADALARGRMTALRPTPARLIDCRSRWYRTGRSGHDQVDCDFIYRFAGRDYRGEAESLRFGTFTTSKRLDREVSRLRAAGRVTAYADPGAPDYAWATLSDALFLPATWGVFEAMLCLLIVLYVAVVSACVYRWRRAA